MKPNRANYKPVLFLLFFLLLMKSSIAQHDTSNVEKKMKYYDHLIQQIDADSIALLYTPNGQLDEMAKGRDSIKQFLSSFKNIQVLSQQSTSQSVNIIADTAFQKGFYTQKDVVNNKDTITVRGSYTARWEWIKNEGWHIQKMETQPLK
ncbi:MAG: nuclear transport factor 2 family protein [Bacteroidota bacterium]|nr:nuclear transport factor 2 family protein [Bacteroidota bacterium]